ncbi:MAG TPA: prolyl oligopeptidase family serine peptidase [Pyrinomonadaceae bacterium]|nr:prolyl oligopeptidase family serine peptidase [Pyrinomonadaceae bacterium]
MSERRFLRTCSLLLLVFTIISSQTGAATALAQVAGLKRNPPKTRAEAVRETIFGVELTDPYRWLEDQTSPETRAWIDEQNRYTDAILEALPGRDRISGRLSELLKIDTISVPFERGGRYFFTKRLASQNQPVIYMRENGKDVVLVDPNTWTKDQTSSASTMDVSQDGKLFMYGIREGGADEVTGVILDIDSRKELPDRFPKARYFGTTITPDKKGIYYAKYQNGVGSRVMYHEMGTDVSKDVEVFGKGYGPTQIISPDVSRDGKWLTISVSHGSAARKIELYVKDLERNGPITPIVNDLDATFSGTVENNHLYLLTNWQAPNRRIVDVDLRNPAREGWRTVVPEDKFVINSMRLAGGRIFVNYLDNVSSKVKVYEPSGKYVRDVPLPPMGSGGSMVGEWDKDEAFYSFSSYKQPYTIYRYQISTGKQEEWARINVPVNVDQIEVKQVWYESKDRTKVPMYVVYKKGTKLDGTNPTYMTAYGGFNSSMTPGFSTFAAYWVEQGGVYAVPNLRGGGEFGEKWHEAGMLERKQNVFDDFIGAAEWLIKNRYTSPQKLAIAGGSNGGLLVGAAMTQRPELFQAVVCSYPLLDMIRYDKFLVAKFWVPEYGSAEKEDQFKYLRAYSPYQNVKQGTKYPAVLFITGDADTRVAPLHARKMAALMQAMTGSDKPILLHYDTKAGHSGGTPVSKQIEDMTDTLSFLFWQLGMKAS